MVAKSGTLFVEIVLFTLCPTTASHSDGEAQDVGRPCLDQWTLVYTWYRLGLHFVYTCVFHVATMSNYC